MEDGAEDHVKVVRHLDPKIRIIWLVPTATALLMFFLIGFAANMLAPTDFTIIGLNKGWILFSVGAVTAIGCVAAYLWVGLTYDHFTYELGEGDIFIREGLFTRKTTVIPYARIQDISSERTLLERFFGLATLEIETAGSSRIASEMLLPGIANKDALIAEIMQKVTLAKGVSAPNGISAANGQRAASATEVLLRDILKELKTLTSKLDSQQPRNNRNSNNSSSPAAGKKSAFDEYEAFKKSK